MAKVKEETKIIKDIHNEKMEEVIKKYKEYKNLKEQAESIMKELTTEIREFLAEIGETNVAIGEYKVKLSTYNTTSFNKDLVKTMAPELYEKASEVKEATRLTIS
jgi:uncharacterized coiled-coil DUF342 family protein